MKKSIKASSRRGGSQLLTKYRAAGERVADEQRQLGIAADQREKEAKEKGATDPVTDKSAVQAGFSEQPENPLPQQHHDKPGLESHLEALSDEQLDMTMRTNIYGYIHMARAALPYLPPSGSIINTGSETGIFGQPVLLDYSATKGAIHAFTMALAQNVKSRNIRVNCVAPGPVWTPLNPADQGPDKVAKFGEDSDMHRPAQPEEFAPAYVFLASPCCASYITGVILPVMGGPQG